MLGLDALASAAYGPEAAMTLLIPLGALGLGYIGSITGVITALLLIVYVSYLQTIAAYPTGGGSYTVARVNLGEFPGLLAAAALLLDYVLVVAVGISAGVGALVSALPVLQSHTLGLCLAILVFIAIVNLRGVRESGAAFILPTYGFVACLFSVLAIGIVKTWVSGGHPDPVVAPAALPAVSAGASLWLLTRAFASGCTAMTGVEAVSNGVGAFRPPTVRNARLTLTMIIGVLAVLLAGIAYLARAYGIAATEPGTTAYQSLLSQVVAAVVGRGPFYFVCMAAILSVLALSANTGFADFPRLCRLLGQDGFLPRVFASRGRRLVYSQGIYALTFLSALLLIVFGGITDRLIPLFAIGAFLAFTLSQAGMVVHWVRAPGRPRVASILVNAAGAVATGVTLLVVLVAKFIDGAWIMLVLVPALLVLFTGIRRHYGKIAIEIANPKPLDVSNIQPPIVILPMREWNKMSQKGLRFALKLSPDILVVQVRTGDASEDALSDGWFERVETPARGGALARTHARPADLAVSTRVQPAAQLHPGDETAEPGPADRGAHPGARGAPLVPQLPAQQTCRDAQSAAPRQRRRGYRRDQRAVVPGDLRTVACTATYRRRHADRRTSHRHNCLRLAS